MMLTNTQIFTVCQCCYECYVESTEMNREWLDEMMMASWVSAETDSDFVVSNIAPAVNNSQ